MTFFPNETQNFYWCLPQSYQVQLWEMHRAFWSLFIFTSLCCIYHMIHTLNIALLITTNTKKHTHTPPILLSLCKMLVWIWDTSFVPRFFSLTPVSLSAVSILSDCRPSRARAGAKQPRGMRSLLSQLSIPCCAKFYTLSHRQVVTVVQTALYPLLASWAGVHHHGYLSMYRCVRPK